MKQNPKSLGTTVMNIFNRPDVYQFSDETINLFCKALKVSTPKKLNFGFITAKIPDSFIISKDKYPKDTPYTHITDHISITKKRYKKIEFLQVDMRTSRPTGYSEGLQFFITKRGYLHKLMLAARRATRPTLKVFLEKDIMETINSRIIKYLKLFKKNPDIMNSGIILYGPPGNGKTSILNFLRSKLPYYNVFTDTINGEKLGTGITSPQLYILDDISLKLFNKDLSPTTASYLLDIMDGGRKHKGVWILCTNEDVKKNMHEAFLRPGRFDKILKLDKPGETLRKEFIESWQYPDIDVDNLVNLSKGWSFAELTYVKEFVFTKKLLNEDCSVEAAINSREFTGDKEERRIGFQ